MATAADNFKAFGLPCILIVILMATMAVTRKRLAAAAAASRATHIQMGVTFAAVATVIGSIPLFFTAAWAYGLVSAINGYIILLVCGERGIERSAGPLFVFEGIWFLVLIGLPTILGQGVIADMSTSNFSCATWFQTAQWTMCKEGWLTFAEMCAVAIVGMNFLTLITFMGHAVSKLDEIGRNRRNSYGSTHSGPPSTGARGSMGSPGLSAPLHSEPKDPSSPPAAGTGYSGYYAQ